MVNELGIPPEEDEDAIRDVFCDVRFDVKNAPKRVYCLFTGKVYCDFCARDSYKVRKRGGGGRGVRPFWHRAIFVRRDTS